MEISSKTGNPLLEKPMASKYLNSQAQNNDKTQQQFAIGESIAHDHRTTSVLVHFLLPAG
jgi:hypothetical protein